MLFAFLLSLTLHALADSRAGIVSVQHSDRVYQIKFEKNQIEYVEAGQIHRVTTRPCNKRHVDWFRKELNKHLSQKGPITDRKQWGGLVEVEFAGNKNIFPRTSSAGRYFIGLPSRMYNLWFTSERLCGKPKS